MTWLASLLSSLARLLGRLGECGIAGVIAGAVSGMLLTILDGMHGGALVLTNPELLYLSLVLAATSWIVLVFVLVVLVRAALASVRIPAFFNALLVALLTTFICYHAGVLPWAWLIGMAIGAFAGFMLCTLYRRLAG
jgi:hypothetical protein